MKAAIFIALCLAGILYAGGHAHAQVAQPIIYNNKLETRGRVAPTHHVVVDEQNIIQEIVSNARGAAQIKVYRNAVKPDTVIAATPVILAQYYRILPGGMGVPGQLYKRAPEPPPVPVVEQGSVANLPYAPTRWLR